LRAGGNSEFLNLGTGHGYSVLDVVEAARLATGRKIAIRMQPPRAGDPPRLVADPAKAKRILGWEPEKSDLRSIISSAWEWRQRHPHGYSPS
jgi:UDP-glucose 4-epimerase